MAEIRINATGGVKLYDADDSHYAQIVAGTITSNVDAITLGHDVVSIVDNLALTSDSAVLKFGADNDTTLTHTDGTGLTLNSTNKLCFNDASQFIQGSSATVLSIGATDEIDLTATAVDLNGTLNVSGVATFQSTPVFPDGSLALADLDIDGGTDIGAAIVDADLFIVDDGAGGTNRKTAASRLKTYIGGGITSASQWRITSGATGNQQPITANWEVSDSTGYGTLSSTVTESSGIFTFPSTGYWLCLGSATFLYNGSSRWVTLTFDVTTDNSSYTVAATNYAFIQQTSSDAAYNNHHVTSIVDVTNTTNVKIRMSWTAANTSAQTVGHTDEHRTGITFIRLGDT